MRDVVIWKASVLLEKYGEYWTDEEVADEIAIPDEILRTDNRLMYGGGDALWLCLMGLWGDAFWFSNAALGVGDGSGDNPSANDLSGGNKRRKQQDGGFPQHTNDAFSEQALHTKWQSTFLGGEANFHWREWGLFNSTGGGRMLNHKSQDMGKKRPGSKWKFKVELSFSS